MHQRVWVKCVKESFKLEEELQDAISKAADNILVRTTCSCDISIIIDSHAALKAINNPETRSRVVSRYRKVLGNITLYWLTSHKTVQGNQEVDKLTKESVCFT